MATFTGNFGNLGQEQWTVTVESANGSGSRSLTLASDPLKIEMDDNDDILSPIRLTTGYLRVVGYDEDLYPTMGSQNTVLLTKNSGSTVGWRGYIQPFAYDINVKKISSEVYDIPVECPLSALKHIDLPIGSLGDYPSFGTILYYIMQTQNAMWNYAYFPSEVEAQYVLSARCDSRMLIEKDADGTERSKYTCLDFIEMFCKFFGYCCRYDGHGGMVFIHLFKMQGDYYYVSKNYLTQSWISSSYFSYGQFESISESTHPYASDDQTIQLVEGFSRVKVNAEVAKQSTVLFEMPNNWLLDYLSGESVYTAQTMDGDYVEIFQAIAKRSYEYSFDHDGWSWYFAPKSEYFNFTLKQGARIILQSYSYGLSPSMSWKPVINVAGGSTQSSPIFALVSTRSFPIYRGRLVISGTTYTMSDGVKYTGNGNVFVKVKMGGTNVLDLGAVNPSDKVGAFNVGVRFGDNENDSKNSTGEIWDNHRNQEAQFNYSGGAMLHIYDSKIPADFGQLEFEIYSVALNNSGDYLQSAEQLYIEDLKIEFIPEGLKNVGYEEKDESYIYDNGSYFRNTKEISVDFASDTYKIAGENSLYTYDGQLMETITYRYQGSHESLHPEYWVAKYAGIFGQRTHQILDIEVSAKNGWVEVLTQFTSYVSGKVWFVISVDKDFGNCTQRIRAIEL